MSSRPRVYVDANVFAYRLISYSGYSNSSYLKSDKFFQDITSGKYEGVISTLTELEYRGVVKKVISDAQNKIITSNDESIAMSDFLKFLNTTGIGIADSDRLSVNNWGQPDIFSSTTNIISSSAPIFWKTNNPRNNQWKSIGGADGLMVNLAIRAGAQLLATFDRGFAGLNNPKLKTIIVPDVY